MEIFLQKAHPQHLLDALQRVHELDIKQRYQIAFYNSGEVDDSKLLQPVVIWKVHFKTKVDAAIQAFLDSGYRVVALRQTKELGSFRTSTAILGLWPRLLEELNKNDGSRLYEYFCKSRKFGKAKIQ